MSKISILVPVYGAERYIDECARSLFAQSYTNCEFIFVNDASTDRSLERLRITAAEFPHLAAHIKIINLPHNQGVAQARNIALDAATGEYILFVDSDDWVDCEIVEKLLLRALETDASICNAWCESVDNNNCRQVTPMGWLSTPTRHIKAVLGQSHIVANHLRGMLIRREIFSAHNLRFTKGSDFGEDYSLLPQLLYYSKVLTTLTEPLYFYRTQNEGSYMNNIASRHILSYIEAQRIVANFIESLPNSSKFRYSLMLGKVNIKKWIFRRGVEAKQYDALLWGVDNPKINNIFLRLYNRVLDEKNKTLILLFSIIANLRLYLTALLSRRF